MYPSDLRDDQWDLIKDLVPVYKNCKIDRRQLINAVFFITKTGSQWRYLPNDYPNWKTFYSFFMRSKKINLFEKIMSQLVKIDRKHKNQSAEVDLCLIDSQSIKTNDSFENSGFDGGKKNQRLQKAYNNRQ